ncbi:hypothetical protein V6Z11_A09G038400 [Gossypium hirsutum]
MGTCWNWLIQGLAQINLLELVDTRIGSDCNIDEVLMDMINIALLQTMILSDKTRGDV